MAISLNFLLFYLWEQSEFELDSLNIYVHMIEAQNWNETIVELMLMSNIITSYLFIKIPIK